MFPSSPFWGVGHPQLEFLGVSGHPRATIPTVPLRHCSELHYAFCGLVLLAVTDSTV